MAGIPRKPFYGWLVVAVGALVTFSSSPGQSYGFSVFLDSIIADTGLSRTMISGLYAVGTGVSAAMVMMVSRMADRFGPRRTLTLVATGLGLACFSMAWSHHIVAFFFAFAALRALGQGSMPIHSTLLVTQWFVRRRGRAIALAGLGFAIGSAAVPSICRMLIDHIGWREAYMVLGVMVWLLVIPATVFLVRNTPEEMGLHPDGASAPPENEPPANSESDTKDQRRILTSATFWLLSLPLATPAFVLTAVIFHQTSIFAEHGLSPSMAAATFVPYAIAAATASMFGGLLVERLGPKRTGLAVMVLLASSLVLLHFIDSPVEAIAYGVLIGATGGGGQIISGVTWAHYYGRRRLGRVQGSAMMVAISGAALGPLPIAALRDTFNGYSVGIWAMLSLPILGMVSFALAKPQTLGVMGAKQAKKLS